jgi:hypothetical protein
LGAGRYEENGHLSCHPLSHAVFHDKNTIKFAGMAGAATS